VQTLTDCLSRVNLLLSRPGSSDRGDFGAFQRLRLDLTIREDPPSPER
jgi:hypothetical protein